MSICDSENQTALILVVDDNNSIRTLLRQAMEQAGYRVAEASNGKQALAAYTSLHPDIVLLDVVMPVMDGFTCCARLQKLPGGDRTPVLMLTVLEDEESVELAFEAGASDYITKPIHWPVLLQRVRRLLATSWAFKELQQQSERERLVTNIVQRIRSSLNLEEILRTTVFEVRQLLQVERVFIFRFLADWSGIVAVESVEPGWPVLVGKKITDSFFGERASWELYNQDRIEATADIYTAGLAQCYIELLQQLQVRANLVVPIVQGQLWGLLVANQCSRARQWQQWEIDLLKQLAAQLAIAIQQSQLYEQTQLQVQTEQALNRVIQTIRNSLDLTTVFSTAVFEIANLLQADRAQIMQYLPDQKLWLNVADYRQNPDSPDALGLEMPDEGNEIAAQLKRLEVFQIDDASTCTDEINRGLARMFPGSWLVVPLHFGDSIWGSLGLVRNPQLSAWQQWEAQLTRAVADQLAIAIGQSTLLKQLQTELSDRQRAETYINFQTNILSQVNDAVVAIDNNQRITYWNNGAERLYNLKAEQAIGRTLDVSHQYQWLRLEDEQTAYNCLATTGYWHGENIHRKNSGEEIFVESSVSVLKDRSGAKVGLLAVIRDITHRKLSEQKIREQAALLDVATDAILVRNLENKILFWNKSAQRLYGWKAEEALGQDAAQLLCKDSPQFEALHQVIFEGEWRGELRQLTKDGKEIIVESRWTLVRDRQGQPNSILTVDTDITEKKQLEAQLLRAQRLESIGTLAGGIAHDLNNVLAPIVMSVQLLQMKISDSRYQQLLTTIENSAKRGAFLVKQVLSFARGVEGDRTSLQVSHILSEIGQIVKQTFPKSIEFESDIPANLWTISGDATGLHQVLMNLVVNARDAMPNGGTLRISAENFFVDAHYARMNLEATVGSYVAIAVSDTGAGIPAEIVDRIFEPFFTTKAVGKGTGLGLATAMGIVKSHGGFVTVDSEVGKGSQFKVYLPAVNDTKVAQTTEELNLPQGNKQLIFVVEDEAPIQEITRISLEANNYRVLTASDGIEAIALYAKHKNDISVVLMDVMMPNMDGLTAIRTLEKINPQVKIIAVSGLAANQQAVFSASVSVKAFLTKPYTVKELLSTINDVLSARSNRTN